MPERKTGVFRAYAIEEVYDYIICMISNDIVILRTTTYKYSELWQVLTTYIKRGASR